MKAWFRVIGILALQLSFSSGLAQRQLVLLKKNEVLFRFLEGDKFHSKLTNLKQEHWGFLVQINEFSIITSQDTIELRKIRKVLMPGKRWTHQLGTKLIMAGVGLFLIDQLNNVLVQQNDPELNKGVVTASVLITAAGIPLIFFKKNWKKVGKVKLVSVGRDSRLYLAE